VPSETRERVGKAIDFSCTVIHMLIGLANHSVSELDKYDH